ncbi:hypothetical protein IX329_000715 [Fusobacterium necrophorum]|nr:hypothetical protein [Fusobacterium necrophorum]MBR8733142.1 hypothetical protein [Fusobacterium necrophorum]MBR8789314.1 hypothetical protein [Fusobacterium necrophorum]
MIEIENIKKYRKKPVMIEAIQFRKDNIREVLEFITPQFSIYKKEVIDEMEERIKQKRYLTIRTLEGNLLVGYGSYILKGIQGEIYPCEKEIFEETYEEILE